MRPLPFLSALTALAVLPLAAQAPTLSVPVSVDTLPNGLVLIVHEDHSVPIVAVNTWYHVGSGDEKPGRTGFAHLFEHLMFMGSEHAEYPAFDRLLEAAGGDNNASTSEDWTNYFESGPSNALPLMLWLDSDRMGWLLPTMTSAKVDLQRDVVKNERRESYENEPYGLAEETILAMRYPAGHPYSWPVVGSMADLSAASLEDVKDFFRQHYVPNNASLVVAGDVQTADVRRLVRQYFADIPRGPDTPRSTAPPAAIAHDTAAVLQDKVELPRLYYTWASVPSLSADEPALDLLASILTGQKNGRLTQALVFDAAVASDVYADQQGKRLAGDFVIVATARPKHGLADLQPIIEQQIRRLASEPPSDRELDQAKNTVEAAFLRRLERVGRTANELNGYYSRIGQADYFATLLARYRAVTPAEIQRVARQYLIQPRVTLSIVPESRPDLAAKSQEVQP
jgi:zinc protease